MSEIVFYMYVDAITPTSSGGTVSLRPARQFTCQPTHLFVSPYVLNGATCSEYWTASSSTSCVFYEHRVRRMT
jgi:hypothetical protein